MGIHVCSSKLYFGAVQNYYCHLTKQGHSSNLDILVQNRGSLQDEATPQNLLIWNRLASIFVKNSQAQLIYILPWVVTSYKQMLEVLPSQPLGACPEGIVL